MFLRYEIEEEGSEKYKNKVLNVEKYVRRVMVSITRILIKTKNRKYCVIFTNYGLYSLCHSLIRLKLL